MPVFYTPSLSECFTDFSLKKKKKNNVLLWSIGNIKKKNPQRSRAIAQIRCWLNKHEDRRTDPRNLHKESGAYNPRTQHSETEHFWDNPANQISMNCKLWVQEKILHQ